jgi:hypothetical protein
LICTTVYSIYNYKFFRYEADIFSLQESLNSSTLTKISQMSKLRFHTIVFFIFRQVLSLMVESLTQFFEENGLSNSTSHAVLDEQIYSKYYTPF